MDNEIEPHCENCDYFFQHKEDPYGICEIDLGDSVPCWGWCLSWTEKEDEK